MAVTVIDWIRWSITLVLLLFHISVTYFIFLMMLKRKNKMYRSTFYILYTFMSLIDIATIVNNFFNSKIILFDALKPWFIAHPTWDTITWAISGYFINLQCLIHMAIAINRAWLAFDVKNSKNERLVKMGRLMIFVLPWIALAVLAPRIPGHSVVSYDAAGELASVYAEKNIALYHSISGPSIVLSTSSISFLLAIITVFRYRYLFRKYGVITSTMKQDVLLFAQAIINLLFQLALAAYYIMRFIATAQNSLEGAAFFLRSYLRLITDASSLCNPIALLLVCKFIQKDYLNFILRRKRKGGTTTFGNNSSVAQRPLNISHIT